MGQVWQTQKQSPRDVLQRWCSWKFRKIHRKKTEPESLFNKVPGLNVIQKRLWRRYFPVNFAKLSRASFIEHLWWLFLYITFQSRWQATWRYNSISCQRYFTFFIWWAIAVKGEFFTHYSLLFTLYILFITCYYFLISRYIVLVTPRCFSFVSFVAWGRGFCRSNSYSGT